jgi:hypothetical protein
MGTHDSLQRTDDANGRERVRMDATRVSWTARTDVATNTRKSRHRRGEESGGAAAETSASAPAMVVVTMASMNATLTANRERKDMCQVCVRADGSHAGRDVRMWAGVGGRTFARVIALAAQEDPPSPVPRPGPVQATGRAARTSAHALLGQPPPRHLL